MKWICPALLLVLAPALPLSALADPSDPEADPPSEAPATEDGDLPAQAPTTSEAAPAFEAKVAGQPWLPTPGEAAVEAVGVALDRIAAMELLLATSAEPDLPAVMGELDAARVALRLALVELGRLRQDEDLRSWLLAERLVEPPPQIGDVAGDEEPAEAGLSADRLRRIKREIEAVSFTEGKMQVLTSQLDGELITSAQASALLELLSFSRDRVDALVFFHPRMTDPENFDGLLSALKFESDRETVRNQLGLSTPASGS